MSDLRDIGAIHSPFEWSGPPDYYFNGPYMLSSYTWHEQGRLDINDAVWGDRRIGNEPRDAIFTRFMSNVLVRRSMGIEQLTLDPRYSTIPNTGHFSRFEHIWGSLIFARQMIEKSPELQSLSEREKLIYELRTFVSDLGHTAFSHLGDWITQGFGGPENAHDDDLPKIMEAGGGNAILRDFDIDPADVIFPKVKDWVEDKSPDLCVDRVDYGAREAKRWMYNGLAHTQLFTTPDAFKVQDGKLAMTSVRAAEEFFRAYSILPTEHWQEPVHRAQLHLLESMVKRVITSRELGPWWAEDNLHPRDALMSVDAEFRGNFMTTDPYLWTVEPLLRRIATAQRMIFAQQRAGQLQGYFSSDDKLRFKFPQPTKPYPYGFYTGRTLENPQVTIIPVDTQNDVTDFGENSSSVDVFLPSLKQREINPLVVCKDGLKSLTEIIPEYQGLLEQQKAVMQQAYVGRIYMNPKHAEIIKEGLVETNADFEHAMLHSQRLPEAELGRFIEDTYWIERSSPIVKLHYQF